MKVGLVIKPAISDRQELIKKFIKLFQDRGVEVLISADIQEDIGLQVIERKEIVKRVDLLVVLGGDGTMLSACRLGAPYGVPILGVNLGGLGFITETRIDELEDAVDRLLRGDYEVEERMMLEAVLEGPGGVRVVYHVLNDVVITKGALARIIDLEVEFKGIPINTFKADGLIVSTPTGSTAYNLSAGGPIVHPAVGCMVITPICPHTLTNRPIVVPGDGIIKIRLISRSEDVFVTFDGQVGYSFTGEHHLVVRSSPYKTRLILPRTRDFFSVLREKLNWGIR